MPSAIVLHVLVFEFLAVLIDIFVVFLRTVDALGGIPSVFVLVVDVVVSIMGVFIIIFDDYIEARLTIPVLNAIFFSHLTL